MSSFGKGRVDLDERFLASHFTLGNAFIQYSNLDLRVVSLGLIKDHATMFNPDGAHGNAPKEGVQS